MTSRKNRFLKFAAITSCIAAIIFGSWYAWRCYRYPYGWSHSCDKQLWFLLFTYAENHNGNYPSGEATPEASLSLLARANRGTDLAYLLRGKTVPEAIVKETLDRNQLLEPESCGWHYVEGLRSDDDPRLALFWDKVGLGHNGERLPAGGHYVFFIGNPLREYIPASKWDNFLAEQRRLRLLQREKRRE